MLKDWMHAPLGAHGFSSSSPSRYMALSVQDQEGETSLNCSENQGVAPPQRTGRLWQVVWQHLAGSGAG